MIDSVGTTAYVYDVSGRIVEATDPFGKTVGYTYDLASSRIAITYPDSTQATYTYDPLNRMLTVSDWDSNTTSYQYDAAGRLLLETAPNGIVTAYEYDAADRLIHKTITKPDSELLAEYTLTLDAVGNRTGIDVFQPLMPTPPDPEDTMSQYDSGDRIVTAGDTTYQFDDRGRMIGKTTGTSVTSYTFDYRDRLTQVATPDRTDHYRYDGDGNRMESTCGSDTTRYCLDLTQDMTWVLCDTDESGTIAKKYVYGLGLVSETEGGLALFHHYDQLGNTIALTDIASDETDTYSYDEFGATAAKTGASTNPFQYVGQFGVMQEQNELLFMRTRFCDPASGLFLSVEPLAETLEAPATFHSYVYASNNPILFTDPHGLEPSLFPWQSSAGLTLSALGPAGSAVSGGLSVLGTLGFLTGAMEAQTAEQWGDFAAGSAFSTLGPLYSAGTTLAGLGGTLAAGVGGSIINVVGSIDATLVWYAWEGSKEVKHFTDDYFEMYRERTQATLAPRGSRRQTFPGSVSRRHISSQTDPAGPGARPIIGPRSRELRRLSTLQGKHIKNEPIIYERYEPKYRKINKTWLKDMD